VLQDRRFIELLPELRFVGETSSACWLELSTIPIFSSRSPEATGSATLDDEPDLPVEYDKVTDASDCLRRRADCSKVTPLGRYLGT
jgi:hypothetical protein